MDELFIPVIAIISAVALPIAGTFIVAFKKINSDHKERMGLIQQGIIPPQEVKRKGTPNRYRSLRDGIILISLGIGLILGFLFANNLDIGAESFWVIAASVVFFLGIGYLVFFMMTKNRADVKDINTGSYLEDDAE